MYTNFEKIGRAEINEVVRVDILPITKRACKFGAQDLWFLILFLFLALRSSSPCALNGTGRDVSRPGWWVKYYVFQFIIFCLLFSSGTGSFFRLCDIRRALVFAFFSFLTYFDCLKRQDSLGGVQWWLDVFSSYCLLNTIITLISSTIVLSNRQSASSYLWLSVVR